MGRLLMGEGTLSTGRGSHQRDEGSHQKDVQSLPSVREGCLMMLDVVFVDVSRCKLIRGSVLTPEEQQRRLGP